MRLLLEQSRVAMGICVPVVVPSHAAGVGKAPGSAASSRERSGVNEL